MMKRKIFSLALVLAMLLTMLPMQVFAAAGEGVTPEDGDISIEIPSTPSTPAVYTVVFKDADGTVLSMQNYNYGDAVVAPEAPAKEADETYTYEFAGWNKEVTNCVGNAVYTATYAETYIEYEIVFKAEDGSVIETQKLHYGDAIVAPEAPAKEGDAEYTYTFAGWTPAVAETVNGNAEYTATYTTTAVEYTVKFLNEDGTEISTATYKYGDTVVVPDAPTKAEDENFTYEFAGWTPAVETVTGNATYTATFNAIEKAPVEEGEITKQPESASVKTGDIVPFHVEVSGDVVSYKWEYRKVWKWFNTSMTGYNTDTLYVTATGARNGYDYRCIITFADGTELITEPAELLVETFITDVVGPNNQVVVVGYKGQFTASAEGEGIKYAWQYSRDGGEHWYYTQMEGYTKPTVLIETTTARDGYMYRCEIKDVTGNITVYTEPATMRVLSFKSHPVETFSATNGTVQFSVTTSVDSGFTYQWQYSTNGEKWTNTTMTGYNTDTLTVTATKARNGYQYRCVLTGSKNSKIESKAAVLHVGDPVVITTQPADVTVAAGEVATFTVVAENAFAYQWQYQNATGTKWGNTSADGNQTATLNVTTKASNNGYKYRCIVYGLDGTETITEFATLTIG